LFIERKFGHIAIHCNVVYTIILGNCYYRAGVSGKGRLRASFVCEFPENDLPEILISEPEDIRA